MAPPRGKVAFITGINGISGNALVENLIRQPESEWSKIVITSRRVPTHSFWQDHRIRFIALDFLKPVEELVDSMRDLCSDVTHAFFASYVHTADFAKLREYNVPLFHNFLVAIDTVAANTLQRIILQTGGKHYGVHLGPIEVPVHEGIERYDDRGENFYYPQEDFMFSLAAKRPWSWNIIRPHAIIGFTPSGNGMSSALTMAIYMLCCREMGKDPLFPGNEFFYHCVDDCSYAPSLADLSVWAGTHDHTKNEAFNHTNGDVFVWKYFWRRLGAYFGIDIPDMKDEDWVAKGDQKRMANNFLMTDWCKDKQEVWKTLTGKYGGDPQAFEWGTWDFFDWAMGKAWPTIGSVSKARKFGWTRFDDTFDTFVETFRAFENAGVLPRSDTWRAAMEAQKKSNKLLPHPEDAVLGKKEVDGHQPNGIQVSTA